MSESGEIRRLFKDKFQTKQDRIGALPGQLGNGYGKVNVDGLKDMVYVRIASGVTEVYNNRVPAENDLLVTVGYDPIESDKFQVLSTRTATPGGVNGGAVTGYAPAKRYQWMATGGGQDPLFVEKRAYLPRRIGALAGMNLQVYRDIVWTGTAWKAISTHNFSLASYLPTDAGKAALVLITINDSGAVVKTKGAEFTLADMTTAELMLAQLPAVPAGTREVLGAVRVYTGQTAIQEARSNTDIIDLRGSGWSAGGGSEATTIADHDHSGDAGDGGAFPLTHLLATGIPAGYRPEADGAGGIVWTEITNQAISAHLITADGASGGVPDEGWANGGSIRVSAVVSKVFDGVTWQVYAYWNSDGYLTFAKRNAATTTWTLYTTAIAVSIVDVHQVISIGIDPDGYIHIGYDMHIVPLNYRKSVNPIATFDGTLTTTLSMLGAHESQVSYLSFFNDPQGSLYATFRDGSNTNGNQYFYKYDEGTTTWAAAAGTSSGGLAIQGKTYGKGVYLWRPSFDSDFGAGGYLHWSWTWCTAAGDDKNLDLAYMRWDGTTWTWDDSTCVSMPADASDYHQAKVLSVGSGLVHVGFSYADSSGHPHLAYIRRSEDNKHHIYHFWHTGTAWVDLKVSVNGWDNWVDCIRPDIVIDRTTDTVYIIFVDPVESGIWLYKSGAGDYTAWTAIHLYDANIGFYEPTHDPQRWDDQHILDIPVAAWFADHTTDPITMVEYQPDVSMSHNPVTVTDTATIDLTVSADQTLSASLKDTTVTPGSYTNADITVDAQGRITAASSGTAGSATHWEPVTNGNAISPELVFIGADILMTEVDN